MVMKHSWNVTPKEAIEIQKHLVGEIKITSLSKSIHYIAGVDVSMNRFDATGGKLVTAGIIVLKYPELQVIEEKCIQMMVNFPYIPGLLSFREVPPLLKVWEQLKIKPDVVMVDGQGIAHPRRLGIATHFGLAIDTPTLGCAKSILYGIHDELSLEAGSVVELIDPKNQEVIGTVLRSKNKTNPLIISPGHLMTHADAIEIIKECLRGYRLPEPTRLAHEMVNKFRKGEV
jgi:deoxyribonuclease V